MERCIGGIPLFVYGTLKKGFHNHRFLENQKFVGNGTTEDKYLLYKKFTLPYLSDAKEAQEYGHQVKGEVYSITNIREIDSLEGVPFHYKATLGIVKIDDALEAYIPCRMYLDASINNMDFENVKFTNEWTHEFAEVSETDTYYGQK